MESSADQPRICFWAGLFCVEMVAFPIPALWFEMGRAPPFKKTTTFLGKVSINQILEVKSYFLSVLEDSSFTQQHKVGNHIVMWLL